MATVCTCSHQSQNSKKSTRPLFSLSMRRNTVYHSSADAATLPDPNSVLACTAGCGAGGATSGAATLPSAAGEQMMDVVGCIPAARSAALNDYCIQQHGHHTHSSSDIVGTRSPELLKRQRQFTISIHPDDCYSWQSYVVAVAVAVAVDHTAHYTSPDLKKDATALTHATYACSSGIT
jgi:hypothetical protein